MDQFLARRHKDFEKGWTFYSAEPRLRPEPEHRLKQAVLQITGVE